MYLHPRRSDRNYHNYPSKDREKAVEIVLGVIRGGTLTISVPLPRRKHIGEGGGAGAIMALEAHAADGSIISARVSHSHACDQTFPSVLTPRILETANPNSIVLQLLTASSFVPNEGLVAFQCFDSCHAIGCR